MKSTIFALCVATVALATPAMSQGIYLGTGPFGPSVGVDVGHRPMRPYRDRYMYEDPYNEARCRDVSTRIRKSNGEVVIVTKHICD